MFVWVYFVLLFEQFDEWFELVVEFLILFCVLIGMNWWICEFLCVCIMIRDYVFVSGWYDWDDIYFGLLCFYMY